MYQHPSVLAFLENVNAGEDLVSCTVGTEVDCGIPRAILLVDSGLVGVHSGLLDDLINCSMVSLIVFVKSP